MCASNIVVVNLSPYRFAVAISVGLHPIAQRGVLLCHVAVLVLVVLTVSMVLAGLTGLMFLVVLMVFKILMILKGLMVFMTFIALMVLMVLMGVRLGRDRTNLLFQGVDLAAMNLPAGTFLKHTSRETRTLLFRTIAP